MDLYLLVKTLHIISATIRFGTGIGIANFMFLGHRRASAAERAFAARMTAKADFLFTLPSVIVQPLSGAWLIWQGSFRWDDYWLLLTYGLYLLAGACWVPVVLIQIRMKTMLEAKLRGEAFDEASYNRLFRGWFTLGWPAFGGLIRVNFRDPRSATAENVDEPFATSPASRARSGQPTSRSVRLERFARLPTLPAGARAMFEAPCLRIPMISAGRSD